jgi:hypothetical protein
MKSSTSSSKGPVSTDFFNDLGRRLNAAFYSAEMRFSGVEYALRTQIPEEVAPFWVELAKGLHQQLVAKKIDEMFRPLMKPHLAVDNTINKDEM